MAKRKRRYLLFVDMLGVKAAWHREGRLGAEKAFLKLETLMTNALGQVDPKEVIDGHVETDAAAIVCSSPTACVSVGVALFSDAFSTVGSEPADRPWLRGLITAMPAYEGLFSSASVSTPYRMVKKRQLSSELLQAISAEKSGYRGMRLLIACDIISRALLKDFVVPIGDRYLALFKSLKHISYPERLRGKFEDVFWMVPDSEAGWDMNRKLMADRLRYAAKDAEEFLQAAATQVVFHEVAAIIWSIRRRSGAS